MADPIAEEVRRLAEERPRQIRPVTVVSVLPDGTDLFVKHWPDHDGPEVERWQIALRPPGSSIWGPPLEIVRVEEGT